MKTKFLLFSLTMLALIVSACASATPAPAPATPAPVIPVTGLATNTPVPVLPGGPAAVNVGMSASLGSMLVDSKGMTLYIFTQDSPNTSSCYGSCASYWPPLLTNGAPLAGAGVTAGMLGTTKRTDGSMQVTYNGWPLYYFIKDKAAGDTTGQNVQGSWFVINPSGNSVTGAPAAAATSAPAPAATAAPAAAGAMINAGQNSALGSFLVDSKGMTLYLYTTDTPNTSNCYGPCATAWPPLLTNGAPIAGSGVTGSLLGTTTRTDGTTQVTYISWPLYYFQTDKVAGDTSGENVQGVWFVITPAGVKK
jgi:predicted lipoprotein with Yx(FWY)xxD motif